MAGPTEEVKDGPEKGPGLKAVEKAEKNEKLDGAEHSAATAWFLETDMEEVAKETFEIDVSSNPDEPRWIPWTVCALSRERIQTIRREAVTGKGAEAVADDMGANLRIAAEGTIDPPLKEGDLRGKYADPADALRFRLRHKPGLIDQIANKVISVTGYDDDDVRKVTAGKT